MNILDEARIWTLSFISIFSPVTITLAMIWFYQARSIKLIWNTRLLNLNAGKQCISWIITTFIDLDFALVEYSIIMEINLEIEVRLFIW